MRKDTVNLIMGGTLMGISVIHECDSICKYVASKKEKECMKDTTTNTPNKKNSKKEVGLALNTAANSTVFGIGAAVFGKSAKKVFRDMKTDHVLKHGTVLL